MKVAMNNSFVLKFSNQMFSITLPLSRAVYDATRAEKSKTKNKQNMVERTKS